METFLATLAATGVVALGVLAYRHPDSYSPIGKWLLAMSVFITAYFAATMNGVVMGMEMVAGKAGIPTPPLTFFGYNPWLVVGLGCLWCVYLAILVNLKSLIKLPDESTDR